MFSTFVYGKYTGKNIQLAALDYGIKEGKFITAANSDSKILDGFLGKSIASMGFTSWERNQVSIITDIAIAIIGAAILTILMGIGIGGSLTPMIWGIAAGSAVVAIPLFDFIGFRLNIVNLTNKISDNLAQACIEAEAHKHNDL